MNIASNPTAAIPMIKKANAAGSCSSQYLCRAYVLIQWHEAVMAYIINEVLLYCFVAAFATGMVLAAASWIG